MGTRDELLQVVAARYRGATRAEKTRILTEVAEISGYHRKHAERLPRREHVVDRSLPRPGRRVYDQAVREALVVLWEASDDNDSVCLIDANARKRQGVTIMVSVSMEFCGSLYRFDQFPAARSGVVIDATGPAWRCRPAGRFDLGRAQV